MFNLNHSSDGISDKRMANQAISSFANLMSPMCCQIVCVSYTIAYLLQKTIQVRSSLFICKRREGQI